MKILKTTNFISERMNINPITRAELEKSIESVKQKEKQKERINYRNKKLRAFDDAIHQYCCNIKSFFSVDTEIKKTFNYIWNNFERFNSSLVDSLLIKEHKKRVNINWVESNRFVNVYCAFKMYGAKYDYTSNEIMKTYMNMLKKVHGVTDETIIDTFFE